MIVIESSETYNPPGLGNQLCQRIKFQLGKRSTSPFFIDVSPETSDHLKICEQCSKAVLARKQLLRILGNRLL
jgi:recombinational DNA repair protein RecR